MVDVLVLGGGHALAHVSHARPGADAGHIEGAGGVVGHEGVHPQSHPHLLQQRQSGHHPHPAAGVEAEPLEDAADYPVVVAGLAAVIVGAVQRRRPAVKDHPEPGEFLLQGVEQGGGAIHLLHPAAFLAGDAHPDQRCAALQLLEGADRFELGIAPGRIPQLPIHRAGQGPQLGIFCPGVKPEAQLQQVGAVAGRQPIESLLAELLVGLGQLQAPAQIHKGFALFGIQGIVCCELVGLPHRLQGQQPVVEAVVGPAMAHQVAPEARRQAWPEEFRRAAEDRQAGAHRAGLHMAHQQQQV